MSADMRFRALGENRYQLMVPAHGIQCDLDRLRQERHDLIGELAVSCGLLGARAIDGVLSIGTFNVSSPRARHERARVLAERARTSDTDLNWGDVLETLCQRTLAAERTGDPAVELRTVARSSADATIDVDGWRLPRQHPTILFGDGGTFKSYLALYVAGELERCGTRVLFCDWELDGASHRERLERLYGPDMPAVRYVRCDRPLVHEADRLIRLVREHGIGYVILDSVAFGCAGPPEAADVCGDYFRAVRQVAVGGLLVAHITKGENADQRPFGSAFWHNGARSTWYAKGATPIADDEQTIGLIHRKAKLGPKLPPVAWRILFDGDRTVIRRIEATSVDDFTSSLPLWQRVRHLVKHGPLTLAVLAKELDAKPDTLDRIVRRYRQTFTRVDGADGVARIALLDRGIA